MQENDNVHESVGEPVNNEKQHFKLFIAGASVNSLRSIQNMKEFCNTFLKDRFELEIIDIYQQPSLAEQEQIIALPLLIRKYPNPERRFIGDLSDTSALLKGLGITSKD